MKHPTKAGKVTIPMHSRKMAEEALGLHIYSMECDKEELPEPSVSLQPEDIEGCLVSPITIFPDLVKNEMDNRRVKTNIRNSTFGVFRFIRINFI